MNRLKELRVSRKLKQTELASILNISQGTLSGWETGRYSIGNDDLKTLADFFEVSIDYLLGVQDDANYQFDFGARNGTQYRSTLSLDNQIGYKVALLIREGSPQDKELLLNFLESDSETKKALAQIIALTLKK